MPDIAKDTRMEPRWVHAPDEAPRAGESQHGVPATGPASMTTHMPVSHTMPSQVPQEPLQAASLSYRPDPDTAQTRFTQATDWKRDQAKSAAGRHSRFVRYAKVMLPIAGLVITLVVFGRMWIVAHFGGLNMPAVLFSKDGLTMVEPRLTGRSRDRAYDISADRATQDFTHPKLVQLEQLAGRIEMKDNAWAKVASRKGTYNGNTDSLALRDGVTVTTSTGYLLKGQDADIELSKGNMATDNPVHIQGPTGWLDAGAARVTDGGNMIAFSGGVHMTINPGIVPAMTEPDNQTAGGTAR